MTTRSMRALLERYAHSHDPAYFAADAVLTLHATAETRFVGRPAIASLLRHLYEEAFSEASVDVHRVAVDQQQAAGLVELTLRGHHTGQLLGIPPSYRPVELPILGVYELANQEIANERLYIDTTRVPAAPPASATHSAQVRAGRAS